MKTKTSLGSYKLFGSTILVLALITASALTNSCSHSTSSPQDTIHLVSMQGNVNLTSRTQVDTVNLKLTCGCPYLLDRTGATGDTADFSFEYLSDDTSKVTPHAIVIQLKPSVAPHATYLAQLNYSAVDHLGGTDYCTLQVSATLP